MSQDRNDIAKALHALSQGQGTEHDEHEQPAHVEFGQPPAPAPAPTPPRATVPTATPMQPRPAAPAPTPPRPAAPAPTPPRPNAPTRPAAPAAPPTRAPAPVAPTAPPPTARPAAPRMQRPAAPTSRPAIITPQPAAPVRPPVAARPPAPASVAPTAPASVAPTAPASVAPPARVAPAAAPIVDPDNDTSEAPSEQIDLGADSAHLAPNPQAVAASRRDMELAQRQRRIERRAQRLYESRRTLIPIYLTLGVTLPLLAIGYFTLLDPYAVARGMPMPLVVAVGALGVVALLLAGWTMAQLRSSPGSPRQ